MIHVAWAALALLGLWLAYVILVPRDPPLPAVRAKRAARRQAAFDVVAEAGEFLVANLVWVMIAVVVALSAFGVINLDDGSDDAPVLNGGCGASAGDCEVNPKVAR